jgi:predicted transcriptional regulator
MKIKDYFAGKRSKVADWYTQDTSDIPLHCKVTDKVLDMIVTLSDPREASLAVVDENNQVVGIVTGRDIVLYMGTHRVIDRKPYRRCRNDGKSKDWNAGDALHRRLENNDRGTFSQPSDRS